VEPSSLQLMLAIGGPIVGGLATAIIALWRHGVALDSRMDSLLVTNGQLQAEVVTLKSELDRERTTKAALQHQVITLQSELDHAKDAIAKLERKNQRLTDENRIFQKAFASQGVEVQMPARRASDEVPA
jgi:chromosome segregation ATPase